MPFYETKKPENAFTAAAHIPWPLSLILFVIVLAACLIALRIFPAGDSLPLPPPQLVHPTYDLFDLHDLVDRKGLGEEAQL